MHRIISPILFGGFLVLSALAGGDYQAYAASTQKEGYLERNYYRDQAERERQRARIARNRAQSRRETREYLRHEEYKEYQNRGYDEYGRGRPRHYENRGSARPRRDGNDGVYEYNWRNQED